MPYDDPDPTDPQMLVGVMLPSGPEAMRDMAYVFAEEFARLGHGREEILRLFRNPFYAGAHGAYRTLGAGETAAIVDECVAIWGRVRPVDREPGGRRDRATPLGARAAGPHADGEQRRAGRPRSQDETAAERRPAKEG